MAGAGEEQGAGAVALPPGLAPAAAAEAAVPQIAQVNVSHNSTMHIGPRFVSVTQNVHRDRVVKGRLFGLWLETRGAGAGSAAGANGATRRLRCSVAVFVCWALLVAAALGVYAARLAVPRPHHIELDMNATWFLPRADWQALPPYEDRLEYLAAPARFAIVGHTATDPCADRYSCTKAALAMQHEHQQNGWADIAPNFLVGGGEQGLVLEGRGAGVVGAMVKGYNSRAVTIMWVGDYRAAHDAPTAAQLRHVRALLATLVEARALHPQYTLLGQCQLVPDVFTPGVALLHALAAFPQWDRRGVAGCLEWNSTLAAAAAAAEPHLPR